VLLVFTGNGKGKTTSAIGQAIRVLGQGGKIFFIQFIKSSNFPAGEDKILSSFSDNLTFIKGGRGFVGILNDFLPRSIHKKSALETLSLAEKALLSKKYSLLVLDEINIALNLKLLSLSKVFNFLKKVPLETDVIFTGRNAPNELISLADIATEFKELKHPYNSGVPSKKGREY